MCGIWILHRKMLCIYYVLHIITVYLHTRFHMTRFTHIFFQFPLAQWKVNTQIHDRHHIVVYLKNCIHRSCIFYKAQLTCKISDPYLKRHHSWTQLRRLHERDFGVIGDRIWSIRAASLGHYFQENPSNNWRILSGRGRTYKRISW